jgi:hypothetical protein
VSQSSQWAVSSYFIPLTTNILTRSDIYYIQPFNNGYMWANTSQNMIIPNTTGTELNVYVGGVTQQSTSGLTITGGGFSLLGLRVIVCLILRGGGRPGMLRIGRRVFFYVRV